MFLWWRVMVAMIAGDSCYGNGCYGCYGCYGDGCCPQWCMTQMMANVAAFGYNLFSFVSTGQKECGYV